MKKKILIVFSCILFISVASTYSQNKSIYHIGWIDFNKNGVKDIYEDATLPIESRLKDLLPQ